MNFFNNLLNNFKAIPVIPTENDSIKFNASKKITYSDLHYHEGPSVVMDKLNIEKLDWCISQGLDNACIRAAIREKEQLVKIQSARATCKAQLKGLYVQTSPESKKFNIVKGDDLKTKEIKKAQKTELWAEYHKKQDQIKADENHAITCAYGEKFFADLSSDEDATGWKWDLSGGNDHCEICKQNAGEYKKNSGPKFPAHFGCTCILSQVYKNTFD
jgi:hypothetical protein